MQEYNNSGFVEQKVSKAVERYLDMLMEPQVLAEATLAQITKTLEMLLTRFSDVTPAAVSNEDPLSRSLRELAGMLEQEMEEQDADLP